MLTACFKLQLLTYEDWKRSCGSYQRRGTNGRYRCMASMTSGVEKENVSKFYHCIYIKVSWTDDVVEAVISHVLLTSPQIQTADYVEQEKKTIYCGLIVSGWHLVYLIRSVSGAGLEHSFITVAISFLIFSAQPHLKESSLCHIKKIWKCKTFLEAKSPKNSFLLISLEGTYRDLAELQLLTVK